MTTDRDVVCSQVDRDEFQAFVKEQGDGDLRKTIRLIDYIMAKEIYESPQVCDLISIKAQSLTVAQEDLVGDPAVMIQETVTLVIGIRNRIFGGLRSPKAAWKMFLAAMQQYGMTCCCDVEMEISTKVAMEVGMEVLEGIVPMDVWGQVWKQFMAAWGGDAFRASSAMATDLVNFIDDRTYGRTENLVVLTLLADWIKEWMEEMLKK